MVEKAKKIASPPGENTTVRMDSDVYRELVSVRNAQFEKGKKIHIGALASKAWRLFRTEHAVSELLADGGQPTGLSLQETEGDTAILKAPARHVPILEALVTFLDTPDKDHRMKAFEEFLYDVLADPPPQVSRNKR